MFPMLSSASSCSDDSLNRDEDSDDGPQTALIKSNLRLALESVQSQGDFAFFSSTTSGVNPCLDVRDLGVIGLPLSKREAKALSRVCRRSHASARRCWELNADEFELRHPLWDGTLGRMVDDVVRGLGVFAPTDTVRAEKHKLLLYGKGASFLPDEDSPKADRVFGTMIVCLPSKHEGGEIILTHNGKSHTFSTSDSSVFSKSCAAWYSDVTHENKPITSGCRLVVTYNLVQDGPGDLSTPCTTDNSELERAIEHWKSIYDSPAGDCPRQLTYRLSHKYPLSDLDFDSLKEFDQRRLLQLQSVCEDRGISLWLANVKRTVFGSCDEGESLNSDDYHDIKAVSEDCLAIERAIDTNGDVVGERLTTDYENLGFIQPDALKGVPDDEHCSEFTGNGGFSATHFYRHTVAMLIPDDRTMGFRFDCLRNTPYRFYQWAGLFHVPSGPDGDKDREEFKQLSAMILRDDLSHKNRLDDDPRMDDLLGVIAHGLFELGDLDGFKTALERHNKIPCSDLIPLLAKCLLDRGLPEILPLMDGIVAKGRGMALDHRLHDLVTLVSDCRSELPESRSQDREELEKWQTEKVQTILSSTTEVADHEIPTLVEVLGHFPDEGVIREVKNFAFRNSWNYAFVRQFLTSLFEERDAESSLDFALLRDVYVAVLRKTIQGLSLNKSYPPGPRPSRDTLSTSESLFPNSGPEFSTVDWETIWLLIKQCHLLGIRNEPLLVKLTSCIKGADNLRHAFHIILIPLVNFLVKRLNLLNGSQPLAGNIYSDFIREIIRLYISRYVDKEPPKPNLPEFTLSDCQCQVCSSFNSFLKDENVESLGFAFTKQRRDRIFKCAISNPGLRYEVNRNNIQVTKPHLAVRKARENWEERAQQAIKNIRNLGVDNAGEMVLGADFYRSALQLNVASFARATRASRAGNNTKTERAQSLGASVAGQKRPPHEPDVRPSKRTAVDTIDLTAPSDRENF